MIEDALLLGHQWPGPSGALELQRVCAGSGLRMAAIKAHVHPDIERLQSKRWT
jgi:hypothetical protein